MKMKLLVSQIVKRALEEPLRQIVENAVSKDQSLFRK